MTIATPITGARSGYMIQFTTSETRTTAAALALYVDACESDMSGDRPPESDIDTARALARRFQRGQVRTVYTPAQVVTIYDALNLFTGSHDDFPEYWETLPEDVDAVNAEIFGLAVGLMPFALRCLKEGAAQ